MIDFYALAVKLVGLALMGIIYFAPSIAAAINRVRGRRLVYAANIVPIALLLIWAISLPSMTDYYLAVVAEESVGIPSPSLSAALGVMVLSPCLWFIALIWACIGRRE